MKLALLLIAVFSFIQTFAQPSTDKSKYHNSDVAKKYHQQNFNSTVSSSNNTSTQGSLPSVTFREQEHGFTPLQSYLKQDIRNFRIEQKKAEWAKFNNEGIQALFRKNWLENSNNVQQQWMMKKTKGH